MSKRKKEIRYLLNRGRERRLTPATPTIMENTPFSVTSRRLIKTKYPILLSEKLFILRRHRLVFMCEGSEFGEISLHHYYHYYYIPDCKPQLGEPDPKNPKVPAGKTAQ